MPNPNNSPEWHTHIEESAFIRSIKKDVYGPRKGGAIIVIDGQNARRGIAKTAAKIGVARYLADRLFDYELKEDDFTVSAEYYFQRIQEHVEEYDKEPSVIGIDEFVGAAGGDKRKSITNQNILFGKIWQMIREYRIVTIVTLPDWNEIDKRLRKFIDYRLWCLESPIGCFQPYRVKVLFNGNGQDPLYLQGLGVGQDTEQITFPNMDYEEDPYYDYLTTQKAEAIADGSYDGDEVDGRIEAEEEEEDRPTKVEIQRKTKQRIALNMYKPWSDNVGKSAKVVGLDIGMSDTWVSDLGNEWKRGKHRDIVPVPEDEPTDALDS